MFGTLCVRKDSYSTPEKAAEEAKKANDLFADGDKPFQAVIINSTEVWTYRLY